MGRVGCRNRFLGQRSKEYIVTSSKPTVLLTALTALLVASPLGAQEDLRNVRVADRENPEFDPLGIRARSFLIYPELTVAGAYDDNVFATDNNTQDDFILEVRPSITAQSQWSRHALQAQVRGAVGRYQDENDNDYEDFGAGIAGRLDVKQGSVLTGNFDIDRLHESREDPDDANEEEDVTEFYRGIADVGYRHTFNRLFVRPSFRAVRLDYEDAGNVNNDDRDRNEFFPGLRVGYEISPRFNAFVQGQYKVVRYDETPDDGGVDRDGEGYTVEVGTEIDYTGVLWGEVAVGYTRREFDDNDLESQGGFAAETTLNWNVTDLTTIIGGLESRIAETTTQVNGEPASGILRTGVTLEVQHELRRNIILFGNAGYTRDDFEGVNRTDDIYVAGAGIEYLINRNISLDLDYRFSKRDSDDDADFDRNIVTLGITGRL